jgi:hypothetical protein
VGEVLRRWVSGSYANTAATLALIVALGGTAVAAGGLPGKNSVRSSDIANGQVKRVDIGRGAVGATAIASGAVTESDLAILRTDRLAMNDSTPDDGEFSLGPEVFAKGGITLRMDCQVEGLGASTRLTLVADPGVEATFNQTSVLDESSRGEVDGSQATVFTENSTAIHVVAVKVAEGPFLTASVRPSSDSPTADCETTLAVTG